MTKQGIREEETNFNDLKKYARQIDAADCKWSRPNFWKFITVDLLNKATRLICTQCAYFDRRKNNLRNKIF
jgi:hypothetical protein